MTRNTAHTIAMSSIAELAQYKKIEEEILEAAKKCQFFVVVEKPPRRYYAEILRYLENGGYNVEETDDDKLKIKWG